jgi:uncharacterized protein YlxW (UPF0749 family)
MLLALVFGLGVPEIVGLLVVFFLFQSVWNSRRSKRINRALDLADLREEVASLRSEVAQLRELVERTSGVVGKSIDAITVKPL